MFKWADTKAAEASVKPPEPTPPDPRLRMLRWFSTAHAPEPLVELVSKFNILASWMIAAVPVGPDATESMRKLVEAKDAAVRAVIEEAEKSPAGREPPG